MTKVSSFAVLFGAVFFLLPLFLTPFTFEHYQTGKIILLFLLFVSSAVFYIFQVFKKGKVQFVPSPFYLPLAFLLLSFLIATIFSSNVINSLLGPHGRYHGGFLSYLVYLGLFFFSLNFLSFSPSERKEEEKEVLTAAVFGGLFLAILFVFQYFEVYLFPFKATQQRFWTTVSSMTAVGGYLVILAPIVLWLALKASSRLRRVFYSLVFLFFVFVPALLNLPFVWLAAAVFVPALFFSLKGKIFGKEYRFLLVLLGAGGLLSLLSVSGIRRFVFPSRFLSLSREIILSLSTSWEVAAAILAARPVLGIGPGNFGSYYPQFRPLSTVGLPTFQIRFGQAGSEILELLSGLGIVGGLALIVLAASLIRCFFSKGSVFGRKEDKGNPISPFLAASVLAGTVFLATTPGSVSTLALFFLILALWSRELTGEMRTEVVIPKLSFWVGTKKKSEKELSAPLVIAGGLIGLLLLVVIGARLVMADVFYAGALRAARAGDGQRALDFINRAQAFNSYRDEFAVGASMVNLALASSLSQTTLSGAEPGKPATVSAETERQIAFLTQQAVNLARRATFLNPQKTANWENLALVYANLLKVLPGADQATVTAYRQAIQTDPFNPVLYKLLGDAYVTVQMGDQAVASYRQAISLRSDLAGAYLGLARVYKAAGRNEEAKRVYEQLLSLNFDRGSTVYQIIKGEYDQLTGVVERGGEVGEGGETGKDEALSLPAPGSGEEIPGTGPVLFSPGAIEVEPAGN